MARGSNPAIERRGDLDRVRLVLAAVAYLAVAGLAAAGRDIRGADCWLAPAFFTVAGFAALQAFRARRPVEYAVTRVLRLFVPALVGMLLFAVPLYVLRRPGNVPEWTAHLWFLPALLAGSLAGIPLLALLARHSAGGTAAVVLAAAATLLPAAGAALPVVGDRAGSAAACLAAWALGAAVASSPRAEAALLRWRAPVASAAAALAAAAVVLRAADLAPGARPLLEAAATGAIAPAVLALGLRGSGAVRPVPARVNDWLVPFFVFSRPTFVAVGHAMAGLPMGAAIRAAIAAAIAAGVTLAACELVRRFGPLRFLAGLRERSGAS